MSVLVGSWRDIEPKDAKALELPTEDIAAPLNEMGEPCPWPWEPQQMKGMPIGMYHCSYCGGTQVAGMPHTDYRDAVDVCRARPHGSE